MHRIVRIGGVSKSELLARLDRAGVQLNALGRRLFADHRFVVSAAPGVVDITQVTVGSLGLPQGGTFADVLAAAALRGLSPCALEVAPHLRLQFTTQAEGIVGAPTKNQAPPGSLTVASLPVSNDDDDPSGFYLRCIDGVLWLRGYRSWPGHGWSASDEFVFAGLRSDKLSMDSPPAASP